MCLEEVDSSRGTVTNKQQIFHSDHGIMDEEMMMQEDGI